MFLLSRFPAEMMTHEPAISNLKTIGNICNHGNKIVGLFDVLPNFPFTTSETKRDY